MKLVVLCDIFWWCFWKIKGGCKQELGLVWHVQDEFLTRMTILKIFQFWREILNYFGKFWILILKFKFWAGILKFWLEILNFCLEIQILAGKIWILAKFGSFFKRILEFWKKILENSKFGVLEGNSEFRLEFWFEILNLPGN
jgi:hypothetical protein